MKPFRYRSNGLWLPGVRAEVQEVKKAHRKPCAVCEKLPAGLRLALQTGAGRSALSQILCATCGVLWVKITVREGRRAAEVLAGSRSLAMPIRLGGSEKHTRAIWLKTRMKPKPKPKNQ